VTNSRPHSKRKMNSADPTPCGADGQPARDMSARRVGIRPA
jgi:hypothetical protein